jgi:hypothetical protein
MPKTTSTKQTTNGTAASPDNCTGSGSPWESGGLCPECRATADTLQNAGFVARRADKSLSPRVPRHTQALNPLPTPPKPQPNGHARGRTSPAMAASSTRERSAPEPEAPSKAPERSVGARKPAARTPAPTPERKPVQTQPVQDRTKTGPTPKRGVASDPMTKPFTATIESYLDWLQARMGVKFNAPQRELAGRAITLYGTFQVSPERKAARAAH